MLSSVFRKLMPAGSGDSIHFLDSAEAGCDFDSPRHARPPITMQVSGKKVKSRKQAVAIALSEARRSGAKIPKKKKKS